MRNGRKIVFVLRLVGRVFVSIIVAKYNIFPRWQWPLAHKTFLAKRFAHAISEHCRDLEHAYVYWIWLRGSASYVIKVFLLILNENLLVLNFLSGFFPLVTFIRAYLGILSFKLNSIFVSFPEKRNGIVFSSGVNYLHSGNNIQSE